MAEKNPIDKAGKTLPPLRPQREFIAKTAGLSFERQELTIIQRSNTQSILPADFEQRINTLRTCFKTTTISSCVCFRPTRSTGFFGHFGCSIKLCSHFADIDRKLLERAKLVLMKNCLLRLQNSLKFIEELEQNMDASVSMQRALHAGHAKRFSWKSFPLKKEKFHLICQTARVHIGHWSALRQKIISDVHLRTQLPDLLSNLKTVQLRLFQNTENISMWVGKLLLIAIEACNRLTWNIPEEALRLLSQAIDEFNDLLEFGKSSLAECEAVFSLYDLGSRSVAMLRERLHLHFSFSPQLLLMRSISLNKLLNSIACERSRIFCAEVLSLFNRNSELEKSSKFVFACVLDWEDLSSLTGDSNQKPQGPYTPNGVVTMLTRNQVPALRIESCSPLLSFEIEEQQFINQLVAHLATCRTLLPPCHSGSGNRQMLLHKSVPTYPVPVEEVPRPVEISPLPFLKSNAIQHETETGHSILKHHPSEDSPKLGKRVQWSVALGPGLRDQLCSNYMAMVWSKVAFEFCHMVGELVWSDKSADNGKLRPLPLLSNSVITTLVRLLEALRMSGKLTSSTFPLIVLSRLFYVL